MNRIKIFELIFLGLTALGNLLPLFDTNNNQSENPVNNIGWLNTIVFSMLIIVLISFIFYFFFLKKIIGKSVSTKFPELGRSPFNFNTPLEGTYLGALFFLVNGISMNISSFLQFKELSQPGILACGFGLGLIGAILLAFNKK